MQASSPRAAAAYPQTRYQVSRYACCPHLVDRMHVLPDTVAHAVDDVCELPCEVVAVFICEAIEAIHYSEYLQVQGVGFDLLYGAGF